MKKEHEFVELRSEEVQELLIKVPPPLLRGGTTIIFMALCLLFLGTWIIHYPDLVRASMKITSINAPKAVFARTDGKLMRLLVLDGEEVSSGQILAHLESTAQPEEVLRLADQLQAVRKFAEQAELEALSKLDVGYYHHLGELQPHYQTFTQSYIHLRSYLASGFYTRKKVLVQQELNDLRALAQNLKEQQALQEQAMQLAQEEYTIQKKLAQQHVISAVDLKQEESKYIAQSLPVKQASTTLINNLIAQRAKQTEILELDKQLLEQQANFLQALNTLQSEVERWKLTYLVTAPVSGKVVFPKSLQENQYLTSQEELFYVAPDDTQLYGELHIPQHNFGKVHLGQEVLIKFASFPYQEYGIVKGRISAISDIAIQDSVFMAKLSLPNGLTSTYGKKLTYKTGMAASAEIITEDSRLIEKLLFQFRKILHQR